MSQGWSGLVPPRVQQDASLAFDPSQQGKSAEEISDAIDASHLRSRIQSVDEPVE